MRGSSRYTFSVLARLGRYSAVLIMAFFAVSFIVFALSSLAEGDSSAFILSEDAGEAEIAAYREGMGLDDPFLLRYASFIASFLRGDWGESASGHDIKGLILHSAPVTVSLSLSSLAIALMISIPLSIAGSRSRAAGSFVSGLSVTIMALPSFLTAMFLVLLFSRVLDLFPVAGYVPLSRGVMRHIQSLFLPSLTLALLHSSLYMRVFRKALSDGIRSTYSRFALSTGMKRKQLALSSAFRPALPLLFSLVAQSLVAALGGAAVIETVFALPGIGALMVSAALSRDGRLAGIIMILLSIAASLIFFVLEGLLPLIDPRIRRGR